MVQLKGLFRNLGKSKLMALGLTVSWQLIGSSLDWNESLVG